MTIAKEDMNVKNCSNYFPVWIPLVTSNLVHFKSATILKKKKKRHGLEYAVIEISHLMFEVVLTS